jgi:hypothetical protein
MHGGFSTGELNHSTHALLLDEAIQSCFNLIHGEIGGPFAIGKTGGAGQVAIVRKIYKTEAHVLLVVGTNTAVVGAASFDCCGEF